MAFLRTHLLDLLQIRKKKTRPIAIWHPISFAFTSKFQIFSTVKIQSQEEEEEEEEETTL